MKVTDIIIWILFIISIAVGLWYLFGSSPTFEQTILFFIITALFTIEVKVARIGTELKFLNKRFYNLEKSFIKLANDFKERMKNNSISYLNLFFLGLILTILSTSTVAAARFRQEEIPDIFIFSVCFIVIGILMIIFYAFCAEKLFKANYYFLRLGKRYAPFLVPWLYWTDIESENWVRDMLKLYRMLFIFMSIFLIVFGLILLMLLYFN